LTNKPPDGRSDAGPLGPIEQQELDAWLNADPRHRGAYVRARAQWVNLDRLAAIHGPASAVTGRGEARREISRRQFIAASVSAVAMVGGGMSWMVLRSSRERYTSGIGEVRRIALADGSTMLLNTNSEANVHFANQRREIRLVRGEALFEVAHDKMRPFIVIASDTAVRAVGTVFTVRLETTRVDVTVTEGVVEVTDRTTAPDSGQAAPLFARAEPKRVAANERMIIARARTAELETIAPAAVNRQLAWREGMVSFDGESLQAAVAEINRHNRRQLVIDDPGLAGKPVVGIFRTTDLDGFSAAAAAALKARIVSDGDVIRLQTGAAQPLN
jgi:transmembrane sensor